MLVQACALLCFSFALDSMMFAKIFYSSLMRASVCNRSLAGNGVSGSGPCLSPRDDGPDADFVCLAIASNAFASVSIPEHL